MSERQFIVKIGKGPDEMTFDECMVHIKRVLFWDYIDGEWCDVVPLYDRRWEELAGYIRGAHEREVDALKAENAKLRGLAYKAWKVAEQLCNAFEGPCDDDGTHDKPCPLWEHRGCIYGQLKWKLRALGIEVE